MKSGAEEATGFGRISDISPEDPDSWKNKIFLTFDIDWAHDAVLDATIDLVESAGVQATWFVTHSTPVLARLRSNPLFELGIHPNFNPLLAGRSEYSSSASEVISRLMEIVPEAKSVRSHSTTRSSGLQGLFLESGITHESNYFIHHSSGLELRPWREWNSLIHVPYLWEDDVECLLQENSKIGAIANTAGLKVFDFHPIHVFLNTETMERYDRVRSLLNSPTELCEMRNTGLGTKSRLIELLGDGK